mgnify:CR=1 FL=1
MDNDLIKAYNFGNYSRTIQNQINLLKIQMKKRLLFELTPEFIIYIKAYADQGIYRAVLLDKFDNPVQVDNMEDFYEDVLTIRRNVLNDFYEEFEKIRKTRNLMDMLDD